jgi:Zn-dependent protease with chaperone function
MTVVLGLSWGATCQDALLPTPAAWLPDSPDTPRFEWTYTPCDGCVELSPRPEWLKLAHLADLGSVRFMLDPSEARGVAYSAAPNVVVLTRTALGLPRCELAFVMGHEMAHLHMRDYDEDAAMAEAFTGHDANWTRDGALAMSLVDFPLALEMSYAWQRQEETADWIGAMLAAQAQGCRLRDGAFRFLSGGQTPEGMLRSHPSDQARVQYLSVFRESVDILAARAKQPPI